MYNATDVPRINEDELEWLIDENVEHTEHLFFRVLRDEGDGFFEAKVDGYECFCTACQTRFFRERREGTMQGTKVCPMCGNTVKTHRWGASRVLSKERFAVHFFQRGPDGEMWLTSAEIRLNPDYLDGKYIAREYARYVFYAGGSQKWLWKGCWKPVRSTGLVLLRTWCGWEGENYLIQPNADAVKDSCLRYSQLSDAFYAGIDLADYLALYCKHPQIEYLWKMGLGGWIVERSKDKAAFNALVNLRATSPKGFIRGLDKSELRILRQYRDGLSIAVHYRTLRQAGIIPASEDGYEFARADRWSGVPLNELAVAFDAPQRAIYKYLQRQKRGRDIAAALHELCDYKEQLERLGIADRSLPHDLQAAHERLSERERKIVNGKKNAKFRLRRHLYSWLCWRWGGMLIRPVDSAEEIVREGEEMHNCVAGYADRHADGHSIIMVLRRADEPRKPWHTVELDPETLACKQCYAAYNHGREPEADEFMKKYLDHLAEMVEMRKRRAS